MQDMALGLVVTALGLATVFHLYWAAGGRQGAEFVVPRRPLARGGTPLFNPSPRGALMVAVLLLGVMALCVFVGLSPSIPLVVTASRWLLGACGAAFVLRAVGEFRYVGFFKRVKDSPFARWDTWLFSPLILLIGLACLWIAVIAQPA